MATPSQVREYLAYWFQLGKRVILPLTNEALQPDPIFELGAYSLDFEACWQQLCEPKNQQAYLEGTPQTIADLLTLSWDITPCYRCDMPVPMLNLGLPLIGCPCTDLPSWPNTEIPMPRRAVNSQAKLSSLYDRLVRSDVDD
jgi:hypothetical protein